MERQFSTHLFLEGLVFSASIGCSEIEKKEKQQIEVDLWIFFPRPPLACHSDDLSDTVCYCKCADIIRKVIHSKHFNMIEHLAYEIYAHVKKQMPMTLEVGVRLRKLKPPVPELTKGVAFTYFPLKEEADRKDLLSLIARSRVED